MNIDLSKYENEIKDFLNAKIKEIYKDEYVLPYSIDISIDRLEMVPVGANASLRPIKHLNTEVTEVNIRLFGED